MPLLLSGAWSASWLFDKNLEYRSNFGGTISAVLLGIAFRQSENPECENLNEKRGPRSPENHLIHALLLWFNAPRQAELHNYYKRFHRALLGLKQLREIHQ